jgi:hypothetical protein
MMTRLLVMYGATYPAPATLDPRVAAAVERYAPQHGLEPEWIDTSATLQVYADELDKRWGQGETIIINEQDKEMHAACLPELTACPEPWCAYVFWINPEPHTTLVLGGFGVTKFSPEVQQMMPVADFRGRVQVGIDRRFNDLLRSRYGVGCCLHGHVVHHHVYPPRPQTVRQHVANLRRRGILPPAQYPEPLAPHLLPGSYDLRG